VACEVCGSDECLWEVDDYFDEEGDVDSLIRLYRVEGVIRHEGGLFALPFTHVTLAKSGDEARQKVAYKIPPFAQINSVYAVN